VLDAVVVQALDLMEESYCCEEVPLFRSRVLEYQTDLLWMVAGRFPVILSRFHLPLRHSIGPWLEPSPLIGIFLVMVSLD
jgi:hypothetical protein